MNNEKLNYYLNLKSTNIQNEEEKRKYNLIKELLKKDSCFFDMDSSTSMGILEFLNVPILERRNLYLELISPENYKKIQKETEYTIINNNE